MADGLSVPERLAALRVPFPPETIGKLPRTTCKPCSEKKCQEHAKTKCGVCGNYMTTAHIHLDFVGHAHVTDRLLSVDPEWTWEPFGLDAEGCPAVRYTAKRAVLWIRLTVCGATKPGVGIVVGDKDEVEKELISDALRNAGMRFGMALDLWAKEDLESQHSEQDDKPAQGRRQRATSAGRAAPKPPDPGTPQPGPAATSKGLEVWAPLAALPAAERAKAKNDFIKEFGNPSRLADERVEEATRWVDARVADGTT